jgi:hypothetical protein
MIREFPSPRDSRRPKQIDKMEHFLSKFPDGRLARDADGNAIPRPAMDANKTLWGLLDEQHAYNLRCSAPYPRLSSSKRGAHFNACAMQSRLVNRRTIECAHSPPKDFAHWMP